MDIEQRCIRQDNIQKIYPLLDEAKMIVLVSPIYFRLLLASSKNLGMISENIDLLPLV